MTSDVWAAREVFTEDHEVFRGSARTFVQRHVAPHVQQWEDDRLVPREPWLEAGRQGFLGMAVPEEHGGAGVDDYRFRCVLIEELARVGAASAGNGFTTHIDIVLPRTWSTWRRRTRRSGGCRTWRPGAGSARSP